MSWRPPTSLERQLLDATRKDWPELIPLARVLSLAPRIEPLLLRNARCRFLPGEPAALESQLWFSALVAARDTREIIMHPGIAWELAQEFPDPPNGTAVPTSHGDEGPLPSITEVWNFTCDHTRHWPPEDRLERDLRYHALRGDDHELDRGLRAILADIAAGTGAANDQQRQLKLARLAKRTLPLIRPALGTHSLDSAKLVAQYAALALGDGGDWSDLIGPPLALPRYLDQRLPSPPIRARLGVEVRGGPKGSAALHLTDPSATPDVISFPSQLPARLHVAPAGQAGNWHKVTRGTRIPLGTGDHTLRLTTLDGRQWAYVSQRQNRYISAKIVMVGDSGVGKTGLVWRLAQDKFIAHESSHVQRLWRLDQLGSKLPDGTQCEAVLWDLAGQPDYRLVHALFLNDTDLVLLVFDPTRENDPLRGVEYWLRQLGYVDTNRHEPSMTGPSRVPPPIILVAARTDRGHARLTDE